jgi:hypothetical protein
MFVQEVLANAVRQEKEIKDRKYGTKEVKQALFIINIIVYVENSKKSTQKIKPTGPNK